MDCTPVGPQSAILTYLTPVVIKYNAVSTIVVRQTKTKLLKLNKRSATRATDSNADASAIYKSEETEPFAHALDFPTTY